MNAKPRSKKNLSDSLPTKTSKVCMGVDTLIAGLCIYLYLMLSQQALLYHFQAYSLFLPTKDFLVSFLNEPGGLLAWAGSFLTQFFHFPALGALLFTGLLMLTQYATERILNVQGIWRALTFLPPALLLILVTNLDYEVYVLYIKDLAFSQMLGYLFILEALWLGKTMRKALLKGVWLVLVVVGGYPLCGAFALVAGISLGCDLFLSSKERKRSWGWLLAGLLLAAATPFVLFPLCYETLNPYYRYTYGLPIQEVFSGTFGLLGPVIACLLLPLVLIAVRNRKVSKLQEKTKRRISGGILLVCFLLPPLFTNWDGNFRHQLRMEKAICQEDWNRALKLAEKPLKTPTRTLLMYRNLAMFHKNRLCEQMFTLPTRTDTLHSDRHITSSQTSAFLLYYHYGLLNYSYRWCMESTVQYGSRAIYLQYMAQTALFNGETALAEKYLKTLQKTLFFRKKALEWKSYIDQPERFKASTAYQEIFPLLEYKETGWENDRTAPECIDQHYLNLSSGSLPMLELAMGTILYTKSMNLFWELFPVYASKHQAIPAHVQEAALIYAMVSGRQDVLSLPFSPGIQSRFQTFLQRIRTSSHTKEGPHEEDFRDFADTFWYHQLFVSYTNH